MPYDVKDRCLKLYKISIKLLIKPFTQGKVTSFSKLAYLGPFDLQISILYSHISSHNISVVKYRLLTKNQFTNNYFSMLIMFKL